MTEPKLRRTPRGKARMLLGENPDLVALVRNYLSIEDPQMRRVVLDIVARAAEADRAAQAAKPKKADAPAGEQPCA